MFPRYARLPTSHQIAASARKLALMALRRPIILHDDYIEWLALVNAGMQHRGNYELFDIAIRIAPKAPMIEIGSFCGLSTNIIQYLKRKHARNERLFTCDKWIFEGSENPLPAAAGISHDDLRAYVMQTFRQSVTALSPGDPPHTVEATSDEFFDAWRESQEVEDVFGRAVDLGGPISFCFIDGNHTEPFAQKDFDHCDEFLVPGGLILFDDSGDESDWQVKRVIERIRANTRYEVVAKNPNYLVRKIS
jgi:predicted O-methyltransferase YrrM